MFSWGPWRGINTGSNCFLRVGVSLRGIVARCKGVGDCRCGGLGGVQGGAEACGCGGMGWVGWRAGSANQGRGGWGVRGGAKIAGVNSFDDRRFGTETKYP